MFHNWRPSYGARTAHGSAPVALLAVIVMVGTLSFALGTRAAASDAPLKPTTDGAVLSQRNQVDSGDNSQTTPARDPTPQQDRGSTLARRTAIATWRFGSIAVAAAKTSLEGGGTALDALEAGITAVELDTQDQYFVGLGGLPNSEGTMELDAAVMDGKTMKYGAVMAVRGIIKAFSVARLVMEKCPHSILAGEGATTFATSNGLKLVENLTEDSRKQFEEWKAAQSKQLEAGGGDVEVETDRGESHDTVGMVCLDAEGNLVAGTSTSGWKFKHPGRVGDSPVIGSGLYCDASAGAAVATGDGEEILRTCLSFLVVEYMREGLSPTLACRRGIERLKEIVIRDRPVVGIGVGSGEDSKDHMYQRLTVAVMAMSPDGEIGAASTLGPENVHRGRPVFPFAVWREGEDVRVVEEDQLPLSTTTRVRVPEPSRSAE